MSERKHGPCWEALCDGCGNANCAIWQLAEPDEVLLPNCGWCGGSCSWKFTEVPNWSIGRMSGFSTSESDFTPHKNRSLGTFVESLSHMKQLQAEKGCEDAVVKGDGAERYAPRDIIERAQRHGETRERLRRGERVDYGSGVSAAMED